MSAKIAFSRAALAGVVVLCCAWPLACKRNPSQESPVPSAARASAPLAPADQAYTVRGRIVSLPGTGHGQFLQVRHEAIPDFIGKSGEKTGMAEMAMHFPAIDASVSLVGLSVGDPIELSFEVRWKSEPRSLVTRVSPLPPQTTLNLAGERAPD